MPRWGSFRGQGLVEFTLVLPLLLIILVAAVDVGRLFSAYVTIESAAKEGALFGASKPQCPSASLGCADPGNATWHVTQELNGLSGATIAIACIDATTGTSKAATSCLGGDSYQVAVTYPFSFLMPIAQAIIGSPMSLGATGSSLVMNPAGPVTPSLSVAKTSTTTTITATGQVVPYTYQITSTGNIQVTGITVTDNNVDSLGVSCGGTSLAPGASMTCTASRTVTSADTSAGTNLTNTVTVTSANAPTVSSSLSIPIQLTPTCTAPTVSFSGTPTSGSGSSLTVTFTGTSTGQPQSWVWIFGDGQSDSSSGATVTHTYQRGVKNGKLTFDPTLTVQTGATCSTTATKPNNYITLSP